MLVPPPTGSMSKDGTPAVANAPPASAPRLPSILPGDNIPVKNLRFCTVAGMDSLLAPERRRAPLRVSAARLLMNKTIHRIVRSHGMAVHCESRTIFRPSRNKQRFEGQYQRLKKTFAPQTLRGESGMADDEQQGNSSSPRRERVFHDAANAVDTAADAKAGSGLGAGDGTERTKELRSQVDRGIINRSPAAGELQRRKSTRAAKRRYCSGAGRAAQRGRNRQRRYIAHHGFYGRVKTTATVSLIKNDHTGIKETAHETRRGKPASSRSIEEIALGKLLPVDRDRILQPTERI